MTTRSSKKIAAARKKDKASQPLRKNAVRVLFLINSALWLGYGIFVYYDMAVVNNNKGSADMAAIFIFVNAAAFLTSGIMLGTPGKRVYYFALAAAALNVIFTLMNLANLFFLISFVIDALILWLLYLLRKGYLSRP